MVVSLRNRRTVTRESFAAALIRFTQGFIRLGRFLGYPGKQCRSKIEADPAVIVHQLHDALFTVKDSRFCIGRITFRRHSLVPIVIWVSGILQLNGFELGILAGRLVEMSVYTEIEIGRASCRERV